MNVTRIVFLLLILGLSLQAPAKPDDIDGCQWDLFVGTPKNARANQTPSLPKFVALPVVQKEVWRMEENGQKEQAKAKEIRLENQLRMTPATEKIAQYDEKHDLFKATSMSFMLRRKGLAAYQELIRYELNKELRKPIRIPVTVEALDRQSTLQLWMNYDVSAAPLSEGESRRIEKAIENDPDLFLFNFLAANSDQQNLSAIMDRDAGLVSYEFSGGFRYSMKEFIFNSLPKSLRPAKVSQINVNDVVTILKDKLKQSKFDWRYALNDPNNNIEKITGMIHRHFGATESLDFDARLCLLRAIANGGTPNSCRNL